MSIEIFRKIVQILGVDANQLLGELIPLTEESGQISEVFRRVHI